MPPKRMETRLDKKKMKEDEAREKAERDDQHNSRGKSNGVIYNHRKPAPESSKDEANAKAGHRTRYKRNRRRSKSTRRRRRKH